MNCLFQLERHFQTSALYLERIYDASTVLRSRYLQNVGRVSDTSKEPNWWALPPVQPCWSKRGPVPAFLGGETPGSLRQAPPFPPLDEDKLMWCSGCISRLSLLSLTARRPSGAWSSRLPVEKDLSCLLMREREGVLLRSAC